MKRMLRLPALLLCLCLLTGCAGGKRQEQYTATYLDLFDTVTTVVGRAESPQAHTARADAIRDALLEYHQLFDIYNTYEDQNNLKTVNDQAGIAPVKVDARIIRLLQDCKAYYELTGGRVNVAMGSVLSLWHEARSAALEDPANAKLPDAAALEAAAAHTDIQNVIIDETASTVYLADPQMSLDVGAIAKGWAARQVAASAPEGLLISVGGNVCATGPKDEAGAPWGVAVENPQGGDYLHILNLQRGSVVTSGDYQRTYQVAGVDYHHIIDPDTRMPGRLWRAVTVVCDDSGLADALSTALFLLPREEGQALLEKTGAQAMWVAADGSVAYSSGFESLIRS